MPDQLKIVIDADVQKGVAGIKEFSKVFSGEFNKAIGSVSSLEKSISASISKINSSLSGLKVTSLDVSVNTSQIDAGIKSIQSKFAALVDPKIDILANATQAEAAIRELLADLSALKGSEIFIRANDVQALKAINEIEAELNSLVAPVLEPTIDVRNILSSLKLLDSELSKATSDSQFQRIGLEVNKLKAEFDRLRGFKIDVDADVSKATNEIRELSALIANTKYNLDLTGNAGKESKELFKVLQDIGGLSGRLQEVNSIIKDLNNGVRLPKHEGMSDADIQGLINRLKEEQAALIKSSAAIRERGNAILSLPSIKKIADQQKDFTIPIIVDADVRKLRSELNEFADTQVRVNIDPATLNASIAKVNSLLAGITVPVLDTSTVDASIQNIQSKFAAIVDPELNVLANTELAETKIKELLSELSSLQDSEVFIRANDTQALGKIQEIKTELGSLLDRQIQLNVNTTEATNKLASLEKELLDLQSLSINPDITTTQLAVFEANIKRVKDEIASLKGEAVVIPIKVPPIPPNVIKSINDLEKELSELKTKIDFSTDINEIKRLGDEFRRVEGQISNIKISGNLSGQLDKIGLAGKRAADNLKNLPKASGAATQSLINLGRVAQDAPFGIIGIANNINPLLESFQRLRAESTSTGAAFKAFGASLIGGGGIGFGVSIVTSLLTQFALSNRGAKEENDKWAKSIQINTDAVIKKQEDFSKAIDAAAKSVLSQADSLTDLNKLLTTTSSKIDDITAATIRQGVASVLFDKKNIETQRLLNAEIEKGLKARIFTPGASLIPEFDPDALSKDPLTKQAAQAKQQLKIINSLSTGLEDIFKKLLSTGKKGSDDLSKIQDEIIARARQFVKEFGDSFVLPNLEDSFFTTKEDLLKAAKGLLDDVKAFIGGDQQALKIKLPVLVTTETKLNADDLQKFLRGEITRDQIKEVRIRVPVLTDLEIKFANPLVKEFEPTKDLIDNFFKSVQIEKGIPITVTPDLTLSKGNLDDIDKKLDLRKQFSVLGDIGLKEFFKIDFTNINEGIAEATKRLQGMMDIANTLNQAIGQGLSNAFNSVFDAILEGKSVFKALGNAVKELIVTTIKAVAQMLILKAITKILLPGLPTGGGFPFPIPGSRGGLQANLGFGGIGSSSFQNSLTVNVIGQISNDTIRLSNQRSTNSSGRYG